jgi:hypothetical protein
VETAKRRYGDPRDEQLAGRVVGLPLILIGYWKAEPAGDRIGMWEYEPDDEVADEAGWPVAADFVDERWDEAERDRVASYLDHGLVPWVGDGCLSMPVLRSGERFGRADRRRLPLAGRLARYLRDHGVRPPVSVIRHSISRQASTQPLPDEGQDWWKTLQDAEGRDDGVRPAGWWGARVDEEWWKTATPDS